MAAPVQLVFLGELIEGFAASDVKRTLGDLFKLDEARLAQMFAGGRVVINRSVAAADAPAHVARFAKLGARLHIEPLVAAAVPVPVPFAPAAAPLAAAPAPLSLEEAIVCPNCGERQSKRLLCRACATNMPMGIAAKLEAAQEARAAALEARQAGRRPASAGRGRRGASSEGSAVWGLGFEGRIGRLAYASAGSILLAVLLLLLAFVAKGPSTGRVVTSVLGLLLVTFLSVRLSVLRCHDCNRSGWWSVLTGVPYLGAVVGLLLSLLPGTPEDNDYGEPPAEGSWPLAIGSMVVLAVAGVICVSAVFGAMGGERSAPEWGDQQDAADESAGLQLLVPQARTAYLTEYVRAPEHKAFTFSPGGSWGWKSGEATPDDAVRAALGICNASRKAYTAECVPINVDGEWLLK